MEKRCAELLNELREITQDLKFNPRSSQQVAHMVYDVLRMRHNPDIPLPPGSTERTTKSDVLRTLNVKYQSPFLSLVIEYKRVDKLYRDFLLNLLTWVGKDGKLHTNFKQLVETGRLSAVDPALQTIPRAEEIYGRIIRSAFIPDPLTTKELTDLREQYACDFILQDAISEANWIRENENVFVISDYSAAEIRVALAYTIMFGTPDKRGLEVLENDLDFHGEGALLTFAGTYPEIDAVAALPEKDHKKAFKTSDLLYELRSDQKNVNFGWMFWGGAFAIASAKQLPIKRIQYVFSQHNNTYPGLNAMRQKAWELTYQTGIAKTASGRERWFAYINEINEDEAKKASLNHLTQGGAGDCTNRSMARLVSLGYDTRLTIHDALITQCKRRDFTYVANMQTSIMLEEAMKLFPQVPWKVDTNDDPVVRWEEAPKEGALDGSA